MNRKAEISFVVAFVVLHLLAPLVFKECYPFTVAPMFRDQPEQYATYQVFDKQGNELDAKTFGLHLVYDGNPPGLGMGIEPVATLHAFGEVADEQQIVNHVRKILNTPEMSNVEEVVIKCHHVCLGENCLSRSDREIRVMRDAQEQPAQ